MIITSKSDYGLRAALHLSRNPGRSRLRQIAESQHVPEAVLAQILRRLVAARLVNSQAGPAGGYTLAREASEISVSDILAASDRDICIFRCLDDGCDCEFNGGCAFQQVLGNISGRIRDYLQKMTLADPRGSQGGLPQFVLAHHSLPHQDLPKQPVLAHSEGTACTPTKA